MPGLFNKKIVNNRISTYEIDNIEEKLEKIRGWQKNLSRIKGLNEVNLQNAFLKAIFENILGFENAPQKDEWTLDVEATTDVDATRPDGIIGFYEWDDNDKEVKDHRAVIELKGPQIALDKDQEREGTKYKSPVDQGFSYTNKLDKCQWVIVSNFVEIRLYQVGRSKEYYETFYLHELDDIEEFKRFYFLLNKDNLINKTGKSTTYKLTESTQKRHEDISVEFYNLYKDTRVTLFEYLKEDNPDTDHEILLEKAQKFLDRIIFICFCEDKSLLPNDLLHQAIEKGKDSFDPSDTPIWNQIKGVFKSVDKGNPKHNINAFNGGLFEDDEILDSLKIRDDFFDVIYNISDYDFDSDVDVNILGHIFEQSITDIEKMKSDIKEDEFDKDESKRKKDGIYYTPQYITKYIVENAIGGYLDDIKEELGYYELPDIEDAGSKSWQSRYTKQHLEFYDKYEEELKDIKVLDPACGSGAFLNQAFDYLLDEHHWLNNQRDLLKTSLKSDVQQGMQISLSSQERIYKDILNNNIFGVDLNEESVEITKLSLWLKTANKHEALTNLDDNIRCGNSLIDDPEIAGDKAFNWEEEFSEIMEAGGFDVVIGNPPYVRFEFLPNQNTDYYKNNYQSAVRQFDLFCIMIERSILLLKEGGSFGFIIPSLILKGIQYEILRKILLEETIINKIHEFGDGVFNNVEMPTMILLFNKLTKDSRRNNKVIYINEKKGSEYKNSIKQEDLYNSSHYVFDLSTDIRSRKIINKIEDVNFNIDDILNIKRGLEIGKRSEGIKEHIEHNKEQYSYLISGEDIERYLVKNKKYISEELLNKKMKAKKIFENDKLLIRETGNRLTLTFDDNSIFTLRTIYNMWMKNKQKDNFKIKYILSILNSNLMQYYYIHKFKADTNVFPKIRISQVRELPIMKVLDFKQINLRNKVNKILKLKNNFLCYQNKKFNDYLLMYSSNNSIIIGNILKEKSFINKIYSGRASKVRNFTVDINANIVTLYSDKSSTGKYELLKFEENDKFKRKYIKYYLENLTEHNIEEINDKYSGNLLKKVLQIEIPDYDKNHVVKKVVQEWEALQGNIENLERQIEETDKKIDQIVYGLYDLTNEEIKIVENSL